MMQRYLWLIFVGVFCLGQIQGIHAMEVLKTEGRSLDIGGRLQSFGTIQMIEDDDRQSTRLYLFNKQSRLNLKGEIDDVRFFSEIAFGAEETAKAQFGTSPKPLNTVLSLKDFYFDIPVGDNAIRVGQFKPALNRESLTRSEDLFFSGRSVQNMGVEWGRDIGAAYYGAMGTAEYTLGIFTGGGSNVPERYIPEEMGTPMIAYKIGLNNGLDQDIYTVNKMSGSQQPGMKTAVYMSGFHIKDSKIGHSTVLGVKYSERSLILNSLYNTKQGANAVLNQWGIEGAIEMPHGSAKLAGEAEYNTTWYESDLGGVSVSGLSLQGRYIQGPLAYALRYSVLMPPSDFMIGDTAISEFTPSIVYWMKRNVKFILDAPILFNTPIRKEAGTGSYEFSTQPNNITSAATRETVMYLRLMCQLTF